MRGAHDGANHPAPDAQQESADGIARDLEGGIAALVRGLGTPHRAGRDHALELGFPCGVEDSAAQRHEDFCCEKECEAQRVRPRHGGEDGRENSADR